MACSSSNRYANSGRSTGNTDRDFANCNTRVYRYAGRLTYTSGTHIHAGRIAYSSIHVHTGFLTDADASTGGNLEWAGPGGKAGYDHGK